MALAARMPWGGGPGRRSSLSCFLQGEGSRISAQAARDRAFLRTQPTQSNERGPAVSRSKHLAQLLPATAPCSLPGVCRLPRRGRGEDPTRGERKHGRGWQGEDPSPPRLAALLPRDHRAHAPGASGARRAEPHASNGRGEALPTQPRDCGCRKAAGTFSLAFDHTGRLENQRAPSLRCHRGLREAPRAPPGCSSSPPPRVRQPYRCLRAPCPRCPRTVVGLKPERGLRLGGAQRVLQDGGIHHGHGHFELLLIVGIYSLKLTT